MDTQTLFLAIGVAYGVLGLLLVSTGRRTRGDAPLAFLATGFLLMSAGTLLQYARGTLPDLVSVLVGNVLAFVGLAYQGWSVLATSGRVTSPRVRHVVSAAIVVFALAVVALPPSARVAAATALYAALFLLPAVALAAWRAGPVVVRLLLGGGFLAVAALYLLRVVAVVAGTAPLVLFAPGTAAHGVEAALYPVVYLVALTTGFGLVLLGKAAADQRLRATVEETETILRTLPTGVVIVRDRRILRANPAVEAMTGYAPGELDGRSTEELYASREAFERTGTRVYGALSRQGSFGGEAEFVRKDGEPFWVWMQASPGSGPAGASDAVIAVTDITELKRLQQELAWQATHDDLTSLPNRREFLERAAVEVEAAYGVGRPLSVAVFDLDRLKVINDLHGHGAGDAALLAVAAGCREAFRAADLVARIGGDEFAALLPDSDLAQAAATAERLRARLAVASLSWQGNRLALDVSIGVVQLAPGEGLDDILARADEAMYAAKRSGGSAVVARPGGSGTARDQIGPAG